MALIAGEVATLVEATAALPPWFPGWGLPPLQDILSDVMKIQ